jgi:hypothetical protein
MVGESEIWNRASVVERIYGDQSEAYVAERIASCRNVGHTEALFLWQEIGVRLRELHQIHQPLRRMR